MNHEPIDALYWSTQPVAEFCMMLSHRVSTTTILIDQFTATDFLDQLLKLFDNWSIRFCLSILVSGVLALAHTIRIASDQFHNDQSIHISSKVL